VYIAATTLAATLTYNAVIFQLVFVDKVKMVTIFFIFWEVIVNTILVESLREFERV
jgi:hypothetical protein